MCVIDLDGRSSAENSSAGHPGRSLRMSRGDAVVTTCGRCDAVVREDEVFAAEARSEGVRLRRFSCINGHAVVVPIRNPIGRPRTRPIVKSNCARCGRRFERVSNPRREDTYCSRACICAVNRERRMRCRLTADRLRMLYLKRGLSTSKIASLIGEANHKVVLRALRAAGIPIRRKTATTECVEPGRGKPVVKRLHACGSWFGRRCVAHDKIHRTRVWRNRARTKRNIPPERWLLRNLA